MELSNLKLHNLSQAEMAKSEMRLIVGGSDPCTCSCSCSCNCNCSCSCSSGGTNGPTPSDAPTNYPYPEDMGIHAFSEANVNYPNSTNSTGSTTSSNHSSPYRTDRENHPHSETDS